MGKSWLITLLIDWYEARGVKIHAIDMGNENNTLSRFHREAEFAEVASERDLDAMMNRIVRSELPVTVIDMRAASTDRIEPWLRHVDFDALTHEHGVKFTAIGVVDTSSDSVANIGFWASDVLGASPAIRYVIGRNLVRGNELGYDRSEARKQYQETLDVAEVEVPKLEEWVHAKLEEWVHAKLEEWVHAKLESEDLRVSAALRVSGEHALSEFMNRSRLKKYQQRVFAEFDRIEERLLP